MAMQNAKSLENYNRLRAAFRDDEQFNALTVYMTDQYEQNKKDQEERLATKEDISSLKSDIRDNMSPLEMRLKDRMGDTVKWVALFALGQISAIAAIVYAIVKHA